MGWTRSVAVVGTLGVGLCSATAFAAPPSAPEPPASPEPAPAPAPAPALPSIDEVETSAAPTEPEGPRDPEALPDEALRRERIAGYDKGGRVMAGVAVLPFAAGFGLRTISWVTTQRDLARCDPDVDPDDSSQPDICGSALGGLGEILGNATSWGGVAASAALAAGSGTLYGRREWWALSSEARAVRGRRFAIAGGVTVGVGLAAFAGTRALSWRYVLDDRPGPIAVREVTFAGTSLVIIAGAGLAAYGATMLTKTPPNTHNEVWIAPALAPTFAGFGAGGRF